jgi:hypothetical protein
VQRLLYFLYLIGVLGPALGQHRGFSLNLFSTGIFIFMNRISSDIGRFAKAKFEPGFEAKEFSTSPQ